MTTRTKILSFAVMIISIFTIMCISVSASDVWDGSTQTKVNPTGDTYTIYNAAELAWVASQVNGKSNDFSGKTVTLANDIDLGGHEWTPIGYCDSLYIQNAYATFCGTFDGGSHTISGLKISFEWTKESADFAAIGLFGYINNAEIKNVTVAGNITADVSGINNKRFEFYVGGICGNIGYNISKISQIINCNNKVEINITGKDNILRDYKCILIDAGGICGHNVISIVAAYTGCQIINCTNSANISINVTGKYIEGADIYGKDDIDVAAGGIFGYGLSHAEIINCSNSGSVTSYPNPYTTNHVKCGGICGYANASQCSDQAPEVIIENCVNTGTVSGVEYESGVVGFAQSYQAGGNFKNVIIRNNRTVKNITPAPTSDEGYYCGGILNINADGSAVGNNKVIIEGNSTIIEEDIYYLAYLQYLLSQQHQYLPQKPADTSEPEVSAEPEETAEAAEPFIFGWNEKASVIRYISGISPSEFAPDEAIIRGDAFTSIYTLTNLTGAQSVDEIAAALAEYSVLSGDENGEMNLGSGLTRAQLVKILTVIAKIEIDDGAVSKFSDVNGHWAEKYIAAFENLGYINGYEDGTFAPDKEITRAEFVKIINAMIMNENGAIDTIIYTDLPAEHWAYDEIMSACK